jgi:maleylpyruvate isomerase
MARDLAATLDWTAEGTRLCVAAIRRLDEQAYAAPSLLPGWRRRHVVAHLAANAEAIGNLVHWARTGVVTPMYASPEERDAGIEAGATLPAEKLTRWFEDSAGALAEAMATLPGASWQAQVVTAQGRTVPAAEAPWMRAREVMVHAVDLDAGTGFADLPEEFLRALREDILTKRGRDSVPELRGAPGDVTAYLAGRPFSDVATADGAPPPTLPAWL